MNGMSNEIRDRLIGNLKTVRERIDSACVRSNRLASQVTLVAVTKYAQMEWVNELVGLGVHDLGEARPQQLISRAGQCPRDIRWHLIGHLQRNKADDVLPVSHLIHSVDSIRLFDQIIRSASKLNRSSRLLLEVSVSGEASKDGFDPAELLAAWPRMKSCETIEVCGLMTMAPLDTDAEAARPVFRRLRELRDRLRDDAGGRWAMPDLSMGMSGDFEVAIEEGATLVRIGSSVFAGLEG